MDETRVLWRGKQLGDGKWVKGLLADRNFGRLSAQLYNEKDCEEFWVDLSTLGECTGLRDKKGKFIFEGDILRINTGDTNERFCYYAIVWNHAGFYCDCDDTPITALFVSRDEVVGNIHDNPELLKK